MPQCGHVKDDGVRCRARAIVGSQHCFFHDPFRADDRKEAQRAGGRANRPAVLATAPRRQLRRPSDVASLLGETIEHVRTGEVDMKVANSVGYLSNVLLKALEQADLEQTLELLESVIVPTAAPELPGDELTFDHLARSVS